jgi:hypothetical protein
MSDSVLLLPERGFAPFAYLYVKPSLGKTVIAGLVVGQEPLQRG